MLTFKEYTQLNETTALIQSFAKKSGKSPKEVEKLWNKANNLQ